MKISNSPFKKLSLLKASEKWKSSPNPPKKKEKKGSDCSNKTHI